MKFITCCWAVHRYLVFCKLLDTIFLYGLFLLLIRYIKKAVTS